jgi:hypothetical protein
MYGFFDRISLYLEQNPYMWIFVFLFAGVSITILSPIITVPLTSLFDWFESIFRKIKGINRSIVIDHLSEADNRTRQRNWPGLFISIIFSSVRLSIKLGFIGWFLTGIWILFNVGLVLFRDVGIAFFSPATVLPVCMPTAIGLLLMVSSSYLMMVFNAYLGGEGYIENFPDNYRSCLFTIFMVLSGIISTASIYQIWKIPDGIIAFIIIVSISSYAFLLNGNKSIISFLSIPLSILVNIIIQFLCATPPGIMFGALPFYLLLTFIYQIIPEMLILSREDRRFQAGLADGNPSNQRNPKKSSLKRKESAQ